MSMMNRRNAFLGWATWAVAKRVLKNKAKGKPDPVEDESRRSRRRARKEAAAAPPVEAPKKRRGKRRVIGFLVASGIGVGAWLGTRGRRSKGGGGVE
jgi:hypothetical protein